MKKNLLLLLVFIASMQWNSLFAQDETKEKPANEVQNFSLGADFVNQYVWRGLIYSPSPNVQPYLTYTNNKGNFSIGSWASTSLADYYAEIDWYTSYTMGPITVSLWDYFNMKQQAKNNYFEYNPDSTAHALEGIIEFNGPESFPIHLTWGTFFYGNDRDINGDNYYSSYFEVAYPFKWKANNLEVFAGITPWEGLYGSEFAMNNLGISNSRVININDKFSLPITGSVIVNPHLENIFFVLTIGLAAND